MDSTTIWYLLCSMVAVAVLVYKVRDLLRAPGHPMHWAACITLLFAAVVVTVSAPASTALLSAATGVPNFGTAVLWCLVVGEVTAGLILIALWRDPAGRPGRWALGWICTGGVAAPLIMVLFLLADTDAERPLDFVVYYAHDPLVVAMTAIYLAVHGSAGVAAAWIVGRWAKVAGRPWLRRGLRTFVIGVSLGILYDLLYVVAIPARWFGGNLDFLATGVADLVGAVGTVLVVVGFALPSVGPRLSVLADKFGRLRAHRRLYPLWDMLRRATPRIDAQVEPPWWDIDLRLTRRLIEINDGRMALREHVDPEIARVGSVLGEEAGLTGRELAMAVEAGCLATAVVAKAEGRTFPHHAPAFAYGADGVDELAHLTGVARALTRSPVVAAIRVHPAARASADRASI